MTKREQFKQKVIEAEKKRFRDIDAPFTIGRIMRALGYSHYVNNFGDILKEVNGKMKLICIWQLVTSSRECTDDDQRDETISDLLTLFQ